MQTGIILFYVIVIAAIWPMRRQDACRSPCNLCKDRFVGAIKLLDEVLVVPLVRDGNGPYVSLTRCHCVVGQSLL